MPERSPQDSQIIRSMLQGMEHLIDACDAAATMAHQLIKAQRSGKPLAPATLKHSEEQPGVFAQHRERMHAVLGSG